MGKFSKYLNNGKPFKSTSLWGMAREHEESKKAKGKRRKRLNNEDKPNTWPSREIRREMVNTIVKLDKENPFREYGGVFGIDQNGRERILWAVPGKEYDPCVDKYAKISAWSKAEPGIVLRMYFGSFHSHPSGVVNPEEQKDFQPGTHTIEFVKKTKPCGFAQPPSQKDIDNYQNYTEVLMGNCFVIGCRSEKVYEYNGTGIVNTYTLNQFKTI